MKGKYIIIIIIIINTKVTFIYFIYYLSRIIIKFIEDTRGHGKLRFSW